MLKQRGLFRMGMASGIIGIVLAFFTLSLSGQEKGKLAAELYESAMEQFYQGKYSEAMETFNQLIQSFPESKLVPYCHYMIGQSLLKKGDIEGAIQKFEFYLSHYPEGARYREAQEGLRISQEELKKRREREEASEKSRGSLPEKGQVKRRICAQLSYIEVKSFEDLERRVKELKNLGVDTIIFKVFQSRGDRVYRFVNPRYGEGVYFQTGSAQVVDDILGKMAEIVHRQGMELFAWTTTRYSTYGVDGVAEFRSTIYNFETKRMEMGKGFNLFHPEVIKRLDGFFRDLARYPIDGILFHDDLILRHNEDFSVEANKRFMKEYGFLPHPDLFYIEPFKSESGRYYVKGYSERFWIWAQWKNRWLMNLARRWMNGAREVNPKIQFAINLYMDAVLNPNSGLSWFSQTLPSAIENGFDYYAIMAYHRQAMKGRKIGLKEAMELMTEVTRKAVKEVGDPSQVMMKIWILDWKSNESVDYHLAPLKEIEELLTKILKEGEVSLAFVPYLPQFPLHLLKEKWSRGG